MGKMSKLGEEVRAKQRVPAYSLSDDQAKEVIRQHFDGYTYAKLAERTGFSVDGIRALCQGVNRGHLLMQVEREPKRMIG